MIHPAGFGSFEVKRQAAKTGHNPQMKEAVEIPEQTVFAQAAQGLKNFIEKLEENT